MAVSVAFQRPGLDEPESWGAMYGGVLYEDFMESWMEKVAPWNFLGNSNHRGRGVLMPRSIAADLRFRKGRSLGDWNETGTGRGAGERAGRQANRQTYQLGLHHLNQYVNARLLWDADQDLNAMLDEYYGKFYGPVADQMKEAMELAEASYTRGHARARMPLEAQIAVTGMMEDARADAEGTIYARRVGSVAQRGGRPADGGKPLVRPSRPDPVSRF